MYIIYIVTLALPIFPDAVYIFQEGMGWLGHAGQTGPEKCYCLYTEAAIPQQNAVYFNPRYPEN